MNLCLETVCCIPESETQTCLTPFSHLVLIKAAVLVLLFTFILEGDDNETYEDVHHEEGDNDDVDDVVNSH